MAQPGFRQNGRATMAGQDEPSGAEPLGRTLAQARIDKGMSIADVAAALSVRQTIVRAIERDDWAVCGGDVYARGHVRSYARLVDLDPAPLLIAYSRRTGWVPPSAAERSARAASSPQDQDEQSSVPLERRTVNWAVVAGVGLAIVAVFLVVQLVSDLASPARPTGQLASPTVSVTETPVETPAGTPTGQPTPSSDSGTATASPSPSAGVAVGLQATGISWVSVQDARGRTVFSGTLTKGQARSFDDDRSLRLVLGNAGAVQLTVNGTPVGSAGDAGEVVSLRFGPGDPA
ncbi:MAG: RodZ domain-containing protein [Angustibacter sp.]